MPILTACFPLLRSSTAQPTDRQPSADESLAYLADDCSGFLSDYVFDNSLTAAPGLAFDSTLRPDPVSTTRLISLPLPSPFRPHDRCRPAGYRRFGTIPSTFLPSGLVPFQSGSEAPQTLDAAYDLLAGWGNPYSTFQLLSHPIQEQPIGSPYTDVEFAVENEPPAPIYPPRRLSCLFRTKSFGQQLMAAGGLGGRDPLLHSLPPTKLSAMGATSPKSAPLLDPIKPSSWKFRALPSPPRSLPLLRTAFFNQTWEPTGEASSGPLFLDSGIPPVASNSFFAAAYHSDPRRVSDPLPVAPIAQRPWEPQQQDSVDESPYSHYLRPSYDLPASCAGSSRHSDSFSTTASHLNSSELPTPSTAIFGHEIYDQSAQLALQHLENQVASLGNLDFAANGSLAPIDSPNQKSPSYRSKSSSSHSAHEGTPSATKGGVDSVSASDSENIRATSQHLQNEAAQPLSPAHCQLPFGLPPHPMSPFAPSAVFSLADRPFAPFPGPSPFTESFHPSSSEFSHLPQLSCRESQFQQQDRLHRSTIMSQSPWSEVHAGPMALLPSPSSSFRGYQQRANCDLSSSPEKTSGVKSSWIISQTEEYEEGLPTQSNERS
ncbi:hypothetical protein H4Q26_009102 [Puccinia striiformis f. sp. tritici PST-130]|nr:hypothetical protein H4Q26_009102 [Puccinia striiformis f. sp. tritici PST-130]